MTDLTERTLQRLKHDLRGRLSRPGDSRYAPATAIWAKYTGPTPRAVVHAETPQDVQAAVRAARNCDLPLSVRGGGHDWAGRALCGGIAIDLRAMNSVVVDQASATANIGGGARISDVFGATDPIGLAAVTGNCSAVGMAGLTLGGGYGPLIGRFGLALDNLVEAEVVLADGRLVLASGGNEEELFWALRGGGGNFGTVTAMRQRVHRLPTIHSGILVFPFAEARTVLEGCADITAGAPDALTVTIILAVDARGPAVMIVPAWSGRPEEGDAHVAPLLRLGTLLMGGVEATPCGTALAVFDSFTVNGQHVAMETSWLPAFDKRAIDGMIEAMTGATPGCAIITHEFKGAASRVPSDATAFALRRDHLLVEILATCPDGASPDEQQRQQGWAQRARRALDPLALPGGYPNLLNDDPARAGESYGANARRLLDAKRRYDPGNMFRSAIPLPPPFP